MDGTEEGDICNRHGCTGVLRFYSDGDCSCHVHPPCGACEASVVGCPKCHWRDEYDEPYALPKPAISFTSRMFSTCSMIREGTYAEDMTRADVEHEVKGTFGGRFEHFGNGRFKYIAYTD